MTVNKNETEINKRNKLTGDLNAEVFGLLKSFKLKKKFGYVEDAQVLLHHAINLFTASKKYPCFSDISILSLTCISIMFSQY